MLFSSKNRSTLVRRYCTLPCLFLAAAAGCSTEIDEKYTNVPRPQTAAEVATANERLDSIEAETIVVAAQKWPKVITSQGSIEADQITTVASEVPGRIIKLAVDIGDAVEIGQPIAELNPTDYELLAQQSKARLIQAKSAIGLKPDDSADMLDPENAPPSREAKAVWNEAQQQVKRLMQLSQQDAISDTDRDAAIALERVAEARYASALNSVREKIATIHLQKAEVAMAEEQLNNTRILSPIEGRIQSRSVSLGNYVTAGQSLVTIAVTKRLRYRSSVPERYAQQLAVGQKVLITATGSSEVREATISRIAPILDRQTRSLSFEALLESEDEAIRPGVFAESDIILDLDSESIVLPNSALIRFAGIDKVWQVQDGIAREIVVTVGRRGEESTEIVSGLEIGDTILKDASRGRTAKVRPSATSSANRASSKPAIDSPRSNSGSDLLALTQPAS